MLCKEGLHTTVEYSWKDTLSAGLHYSCLLTRQRDTQHRLKWHCSISVGSLNCTLLLQVIC